MPHIIVKMIAGRSPEQKELIAAEVTKSIMATAQVGEDSVSVSIEEFEPADWTAKVYQPDILGKAATLYKKPGYA